MHVWNVLHAARWKYRTQKIAILAPSHNFVGLYLRNYGMYRQSGKNLLYSNISSTCPDNMVNFGLLTAEICWRVWGTPANFNGFRVLAALLHSTLVVGVSQTLRRWTEGATYIRQGGHHVGHWPTFLVSIVSLVMAIWHCFVAVYWVGVLDCCMYNSNIECLYHLIMFGFSSVYTAAHFWAWTL